MMLYANNIAYIDDQARVAEIRPTHRAYLKGLAEKGKLAAAGPLSDGSGALFVYYVADLDEANALAAADPYFTGGVIKEQRLHPWDLVYSNVELLRQPS